MVPNEKNQSVSSFLTPQELAEFAKLRRDPDVTGYALIGFDGEEIDSSGVWDTTVPVFANIFDLADGLGGEFGEERSASMVILESGALEVVGLTLSSAKAVIVRRKAAKPREGLRSVG